MTVYVGKTQDLEATRAFFLEQKKGMYPDIIMGPIKKKADAANYIKFMQNKFPDCVEIDLPAFRTETTDPDKWWVFSFELIGGVH